MNKLYLLLQKKNNNYDTYDSCVVVATSEKEARLIHPNGLGIPDEKSAQNYPRSWCAPEHVDVEYVGIASDTLPVGYVVCASFNAG